jgi:hypothetical protein
MSASARECAPVRAFCLALARLREKIARMATAPAATALPLAHHIIPTDELAAALRAAFDTLVGLMTDRKAHPRERRLAATAILRLAPRPHDAGPESAKVRIPGPTPPAPAPRKSSRSPSGFAEEESKGEGSMPPHPANLQIPAATEREERPAKPVSHTARTTVPASESTPATEPARTPPVIIPLNDDAGAPQPVARFARAPARARPLAPDRSG